MVSPWRLANLSGSLNAGEHQVQVSREGFSSVTEAVELKAGDGPTYLVLHLKPTQQITTLGGRNGGLVESMTASLGLGG